jgi:hypothetical protein
MVMHMPDTKYNQNFLISFRNEKLGGRDLSTDIYIYNPPIRRSAYQPSAKKRMKSRFNKCLYLHQDYTVQNTIIAIKINVFHRMYTVSV